MLCLFLPPLAPTHAGLLTSRLSPMLSRKTTSKVFKSTGAQASPVGKEEKSKRALYLVSRSMQVRRVRMTHGPLSRLW